MAVIDWEDAVVGDPLSDVSSRCLEILWAFGIDAMHHFTQAYQTSVDIDFANLPYWDLCAALRLAGKLGSWGLDAEVEQAMRGSHARFVDQALSELAGMKKSTGEC